MKRKFSVFVILLTIAIILVGCSEETKASDKAVSVGKQAIATADDYLDGNITYDDASDRLDELKEQMEYVDDLEQDDENKVSDFSISVDVSCLSTSIFLDDAKKTDDSYDDVVEVRNSLAETIGENKR